MEPRDWYWLAGIAAYGTLGFVMGYVVRMLQETIGADQKAKAFRQALEKKGEQP